jgi:hypothetical protein
MGVLTAMAHLQHACVVRMGGDHTRILVLIETLSNVIKMAPMIVNENNNLQTNDGMNYTSLRMPGPIKP